MIPDEKLNSLLLLSKSRVNCYLSCPHAFMLGYIAEIKGESNPALDLGTEVHKFHEDFLKTVSFEDEKIVCNIDIPDHNIYFQNIVDYHKNRWNELGICDSLELRKKYFLPVVLESEMRNEDLHIRGIPDAIFNDIEYDTIAFEVKTGYPTAEKIDRYREDLVWYKLLAEGYFRDNKEGVDWQIDYGKIYFPVNNCEITHEILDRDVKAVIEKIRLMNESVRVERFEAAPELAKCSWCGFRNVCEHSLI